LKQQKYGRTCVSMAETSLSNISREGFDLDAVEFLATHLLAFVHLNQKLNFTPLKGNSIKRFQQCATSKLYSKTGRPFNLEFRKSVIKHVLDSTKEFPNLKVTLSSVKRAGEAVQAYPRFQNVPSIMSLKFSFKWCQKILSILVDSEAVSKQHDAPLIPRSLFTPERVPLQEQLPPNWKVHGCLILYTPDDLDCC
jgi:hypothetical protein